MHSSTREYSLCSVRRSSSAVSRVIFVMFIVLRQISTTVVSIVVYLQLCGVCISLRSIRRTVISAQKWYKWSVYHPSGGRPLELLLSCVPQVFTWFEHFTSHAGRKNDLVSSWDPWTEETFAAMRFRHVRRCLLPGPEKEVDRENRPSTVPSCSRRSSSNRGGTF